MKWKTYSIHLLLALATGSMVALSYSYGLFSDLEARLEDNFYSTHTPDTRLVVLAIDDDSLSRIGQWPWPRSVYAKVLASLDKASPRALGIDVLLSEPSRLGAYDDDVLKRSLESLHFPVVLGAEAEHMLLQEKSVTSPSLVSPLQQFITPHTSVGLVNVISDKDGVVRSFPYSATINNTSYLTLGAKVLTEAKLLSTPPHCSQGYKASPLSAKNSFSNTSS
jgi:adenylate cyclase